MPFRSPRQEIFLAINHPEIHKRWYKKYGHSEGYSSYLKRRKRKSYGKRKRG